MNVEIMEGVLAQFLRFNYAEEDCRACGSQ